MSRTIISGLSTIIVLALAGFSTSCMLPNFEVFGSPDAAPDVASDDTGSTDEGGSAASSQTEGIDGGIPNKPSSDACATDADCLSRTCYQASHTCASGSAPPSCSGGLTCADGLSCCDRTVVEGGIFPMGRSTLGNDACPAQTTCDPSEQPEHQATVASFALDTFEITVGRFRSFVEYLAANPGWQPKVGAGAHPLIPDSGWNQGGWTMALPNADEFRRRLKCDSNYQIWTDTAGAKENHPINCVNWYEVFAFCAWDGGRLATEAEWEYAAAGGAENRLYPWGNTLPDPTYANFYTGLYCSFSTGYTLPVGWLPKGNGRWGQRDLAGNLWEWTLDTYSPYTSNSYDNWANVTFGLQRMIRGGDGFCSAARQVRTARRYPLDPSTRRFAIGSRCARTP